MAGQTTFAEVMAGTVRFRDAADSEPLRLDLRVALPGVLLPWRDVTGTLSGRVSVPGRVDDAAATGTLRVAPLAAGQIRYRLDFADAGGRRMRLDGWKTVRARHPVRSMTVLPATVYAEDGAVLGEAQLRFDLRSDLMRFLGGFRYRRTAGGSAERPAGRPVRTAAEPGAGPAADAAAGAAADPMVSRWRGQPGRLEVWYTTLTDPVTGTGVWLHHELVAPTDGRPAYAHGWAAVFPPDGRPALARFGPEPWQPADGAVFATAAARVSAERLVGEAKLPAAADAGEDGPIGWDLAASGGGATLYTFPRWAWERERLPAAQVVPDPAARFTGVVRAGGRELALSGAPGATARIYGHGNARRWAWLHADLGGGDVLEVVAAVSTRPGLRRLPPMPFVRLRLAGVDLPAGDPLLAARRLRAQIGLPTWRVAGRVGDHRLEVVVTQPPERTVAVDYTNPDGTAAVCRNSERASAEITWSGPDGQVDRSWRLDGTAHAEVGEHV